MSISQDQKFEFDILGYFHLRNALSPAEVAEYLDWGEQIQNTDLQTLNSDRPENLKHQLNRPVSRIFDADPRFACFLDHPAVEPFLVEFLG